MAVRPPEYPGSGSPLRLTAPGKEAILANPQRHPSYCRSNVLSKGPPPSQRGHRQETGQQADERSLHSEHSPFQECAYTRPRPLHSARNLWGKSLTPILPTPARDAGFRRWLGGPLSLGCRT